MMLPLLFALCLQAGHDLPIGEPINAVMADDAAKVETPALAARPEITEAVGVAWTVQVADAGTYTIDLHSFNFDAYLILYAADGTLIGENDDGLLRKHSRLQVELQEDQAYRLMACSLSGGKGDYRIQLRRGTVAKLNPAETALATEADIQTAIEYWGDQYGKANDGFIYLLQELGAHYHGQGRSADAVSFFQQALAMNEQLHGADHASNAGKLNNLAVIYSATGQIDEAAPLYRRALAISEATYGTDHLQTAGCLMNLASSLQAQGNLSEAMLLLRRSVDLCQKLAGKEHPYTLNARNQIAALMHAAGEKGEARRMFEEQLQLLEKVSGPNHASTAICCNNLAMALEGLGEYEAARLNYERALQVFESLVGPEHPRVLLTKANLASLLHKQGDEEGALELLEQTLAVRIKVLGEQHPDVANHYNLLGGILQLQGKFERSLAAHEKALAIRRQVFGDEHAATASCIHGLALLFQNQGEWEKAKPLQVQAWSLRKKILGPTHPDTAVSLHNLALVNQNLGLREQAGPQFKQSVQSMEQGLGAMHPKTVKAMANQAIFLFESGEAKPALGLWREALRRSLRNVDRELPTMSESGRFQLLAQSLKPRDLLAALATLKSMDLTADYGLFVDWKGKATRMQQAGMQLSQTQTDEASKLVGQVQVVSKKLAQQVHLTLDRQTADHAEALGALRDRRLELERSLNQALGIGEVLQPPDLEGIRKNIPDQAVLVDFYCDQQVYAWVIHATGPPKLLHLGAADQLRELQQEYLSKTAIRGGRRVEEDEQNPGDDLTRALWSPIQQAAGDVDRFIICPDGFISELPFGILPDADGKFQLERFRFHYLADASQLIPQGSAQADSAAEGTLLAVGGVNYFKREELADGGQQVEVSSRSRVGNSWSTLAATRDELRFLEDLHQYVLEWESPFHSLEGKGATEEAVRAHLPGSRYVHIATHGYFEPEHLPSLLYDAAEQQAEAQIGEQVQAVGLLPGLLSGLVFAGVNGEPDSNREDGYLSAEEIQHLDLSACEMVVLSACETALGSARAGEGLMSLRRAFSIAGANTVISSLWKVDDHATAQLMKDFYTNLWQKNHPRGEALHQAKLSLLRRNRLEAGETNPATWGAFVLSGDWR